MSWEDGKLVEARVKGNESGSVKVFYGGREMGVGLEAGGTILQP